MKCAAIGTAAYIGLNDSFERSAAGLGSDAVVVEYDARFDYRPGPPNGSTATMTAGPGAAVP